MRFTVEGSGSFPIDMLRYDACWPATQADVSTVESSFLSVRLRGPGPRKVTVETNGARRPTRDRWASFGWAVIE